MDPSDYMKDPRPAPQSQLTTSLPGINTYVTTHDTETGKSVLHSTREGDWKHYGDKEMAMTTVYAAPHNPSFENDEDLKDSDGLIASGKLGLVRPDGNVCRYVDLSPGYESIMHRTVSADIGVVIEGTVELVLDDGSVQLIRRGDTVIQRGTNHAWRNASKEHWARMIFFLSSAKPLTLGGKEFGEEVAEDAGIPPSGSHD